MWAGSNPLLTRTKGLALSLEIAMKTISHLASILLIAAAISTATSVQAGSTPWGALAARSDSNPSLQSMLTYAIQDEYSARAEYEAIMAKFGNMKPFSNIIQSEQSHIAWLKDAYAARKLSVPADEASKHTVIPVTLKSAFEIGVQAEIANIAMYDQFLATEVVKKPENATLKSLFTRLRDASRNHLKAFQRGLSKY